MKIRKITLTIAGATLLAGSAAAITSAQASTYSPEKHSFEWCHETFGENQHDLCNYYNWAKENARILRQSADPQAEDYQFQADEALRRLYAEQKQGI
ncbi:MULTISPECIES: hypothetical protein [Corynebacterium]|uniref:Secreted protein n=2 Tax=Corynebacterium TaxID=1716 RepID=A0ABD0BF85_CORUL|nr:MULTISPECIES: hypothetical protein [Corynebacterium]AIU32204.1 Hypothetical protein CulFRC11_0612 [Corynebacterium ramonii FRC0011]ESU59020.1 hypothetical protein D881_04130 [Corynebacterium ulcerans NCTC 12077]KKO86669.1 hypothetical protein VH13_03095 [Corynebacterium ulcerans]KKO88086.1 hypothetical protein VH15_01805 [Corynebacterium ulcerans]KPH77727.1 hypothetical protein AFK72_03250 [Corynebacterium ulcerans]